jgi:serine/threonine-protein kinase
MSRNRGVGTRFDDRFRLLGVLGQGAMGAVYDVSDERLEGVRWALKELDLGVVLEKEKDEAVALFRREAEILASLSHPGCPRVVHEFITDRGAPAFVMSKIDGVPLDQLLEQVHRPLSIHEALPVLLQVCHILEHLHAQDPPVIFRDLKPSNLILTDHGAVYLIDFGIARRHDPKKTKDTQDLGTPGFCSPEQYGRGQTTPRSDLYALGSTAYFLLTLADLQSYAFKVPPLTEALQDPGADKLSKLLAELLQLVPKDRPANVKSVRLRLEAIMAELKPVRDRSTRILHPALRALTNHPIHPKSRLRVFNARFFWGWFRTFF